MKAKNRLGIEPRALSCIGMFFIILSPFILAFSLDKEFPQNLYGLWISGFIGLIFIFLDYQFVEKDSLVLYMGICAILILGIPTYMSYMEYKEEHFFDENEIISCDKNISKCVYGILAINPKENYFFCEDSGERSGSKENYFMVCQWRAKN